MSVSNRKKKCVYNIKEKNKREKGDVIERVQILGGGGNVRAFNRCVTRGNLERNADSNTKT